MFKKPFVVFDLETSGLDPKKSDIIEIAMIRYEEGEEVKRLDALIKRDEPLEKIIQVITGITDKMLQEEGRDQREVFTEANELIKGAYLVAHNAPFDVGFIKEKGFNLSTTLGVLDTIPLAQMMFPDLASYSLESLSDDFKIKHANAHRAMADVEATVQVFEHIWKAINKLPKRVVTEIEEQLEKSPWDGLALFKEATGGSSTSKHVSKEEALNMTESFGVKKSLEVMEVFGDDGVLSKFWEDYEQRHQQVEMSQAVASAFQEGYHLICEAPTGVGKSLAYLIPAAERAIANKSKVVISTNTVNLQQQLFEKDIPLLHQIYKNGTNHKGVSVALLKGRSHYLCLRRLAEFKRRPRFTVDEAILLAKILIWVQKTNTGDSTEIHLARHELPLWNFELCSDKNHCSPQKCKAYGDCYLHRARQKAEDADIIIVNHALLCADLQSGNALLPDYQYLVVDEAHHFEEVATKAYGIEMREDNILLPLKVIKNHLEDLTRRFEGTLFVNQSAFEHIDPLLEDIEGMKGLVENVFSVIAMFVNRNVPDSGYVENLLVDRIILGTEEWMNLTETSETFSKKLNAWLKKLKDFSSALLLAEEQEFPEQDEFVDELMQEIEQLAEQLSHLKHFFSGEEDGGKWIRWMTSDYQGRVAIHVAPILAGEILKTELYDQKTSIVLTSATLAIKLQQEGFNEAEQHPFTYMRRMLSLDTKFEELILSSPYDFETQTYVMLPNDTMPVTSPKSMEELTPFFAQLIEAVKGNMLGLFTSYRAIETLYLALMEPLQSTGTTLLAQGISGGRNKILKAFLGAAHRSALFGTSSFWEGVDIKGDALSTLVIHKLPFDMPNDPIVKARSELFGNAFFEYSVPRAVLRFRQGFGRLIRSQKDYGVMVVLDNRCLTKEYGKLFLKALPNVTIEEAPLMDIPEKTYEWLQFAKEN